MIYHSMHICNIFLVKTSDILHPINTFFLSCLVHIGRCDLIMIIYIRIVLPRVAKASIGEELRWEIINIFAKKLGQYKWTFISKFGFVPFRHHYLTWYKLMCFIHKIYTKICASLYHNCHWKVWHLNMLRFKSLDLKLTLGKTLYFNRDVAPCNYLACPWKSVANFTKQNLIVFISNQTYFENV